MQVLDLRLRRLAGLRPAARGELWSKAAAVAIEVRTTLQADRQNQDPQNRQRNHPINAGSDKLSATGDKVSQKTSHQGQADENDRAEGMPRTRRRQLLNDSGREAGVINVGRGIAQLRVEPIFVELFVHL